MIDRVDCMARDRADPLARLRERFHLPEGVIYLDGNSLGVLPKAVTARLQQVVATEWGEGLIRSWNDAGWWDYPKTIGDKIARLIGAAPGEVVATDTTSVNLFKLLVAALALRPGRKVILSDPGNFPTDLYVAQGISAMLGQGYRLKLVPGEAIQEAIDDSVAVVMLTHVDYKTARIYEMARITGAAHQAGALMLWDLAHSAGAVPVDLAGAAADLAVGCGYKYLNGGPGAPAYLYVRRDLQDSIRPPLSGWWGHAEPFAFATDYQPAAGIARNLCGTQSVLAMASLDAALDIWAEVDLAQVRAKSMALTELFIGLVDQYCADPGLTLASPRDAALRGSHVSLRHPDGYAVAQALRERGVIGDFRSPDLMRFGITPLYIGYTDIFDAVGHLADILRTRAWDSAKFRARDKVT
ncbi:MAG TPA: kynureninase [Alphaproteobacteria bacterium]|nr:kynureninase [Alphaproteobacteria bacterium]